MGSKNVVKEEEWGNGEGERKKLKKSLKNAKTAKKKKGDGKLTLG